MLNSLDAQSKAVLAALSGLSAKQAEAEEGPHHMIGNEKIKSLWRERFKGKETVLWRSFFDVFPSQARDSCGLSVEDITVRCLVPGCYRAEWCYSM